MMALPLHYVCVASIGVMSLAAPPPRPKHIVGGVEAKEGEFPFIVTVRNSQSFCGGSVITSEWIVTAAHCSQDDAYKVVAGDLILGKSEGNEQYSSVVRMVIHPGYQDSGTMDNDIALMKVSPPFNFTNHVQPIQLASEGFTPPPSANLVVSGWGRLSESGKELSKHLMKVDVPYIPEDECRKAYGNDITEAMLCAGETGKDSCQGDSGGPLIWTDEGGRRILCGVVSWGHGCARPEKPGVYAKVSHFTKWILSVIGME